MPTNRTSIHGEWSNRLAFILAATGSAVGLGNIWKFPYVAGENGGGAFVLVYLICVAVIGIPIMISEVMLGRRGRQSPINTMRTLANDEGRSRHWSLLGWMGVLAGLLILSYYSVIAGWCLSYVFRSAAGVFTGADASYAGAVFDGLVGDPERLLGWHTLFIVISMIVVARGVTSGIERAVRFLMPALFVLLILLVGYAMSQGEFMQGVAFLFEPDFSKLDAEAILTAMGQAFFSLSLGMGAIMIYGSYLPQDAAISGTSIIVALSDTAVALVAGLAIFPLVFAHGLEPAQGPGLIFRILPIAFGQMPGGVLFGTLFFVLLVFAAWTSAISLIEPAVTWFVENHGLTRVHATVIGGIVTWALGLGTVFSFNIWSDFTVFGKNYFEVLDYLTANIMLPLGGLLIAVFAAWLMRESASRDELALDTRVYRIWQFLLRYVTPVGVTLVFLNAIGVI
ncbi:MAG: sodium-dependent transporter [Pseudomonadota bacterium]|nr:sodium-dependent transporter [Pseudomonadota bacterium]